MAGLHTRRQWLRTVTASALGAALLTSRAQADPTKTRVEANTGYALDFESEGKISLGSEEQKHEMVFTVNCQQEFDERLIVRDDVRLAARQYHTANLQKRFGKQDPETITLAEGDRKVLAYAESINSGKMEYRTQAMTLTGDQWKMLQTPLSPIWLSELAEQMLGDRDQLVIGDKIDLPDALVARLFCLEEITTSSIQCQVEKANRTQAVLKLAGEAEGRVLDAKTNLKINSSLRCIFADRRISQLRASIVETREEGGVHPEFTARTRMKIDEVAPKAEMPQTEIATLLGLLKKPAILTYVSDNNPIRLQHTNQWHLVMDQRGEITWRMIAEGEALTQCKLLLLATKNTDADVSLKDWIDVVQSAHSEIETEIVSQETVTGANNSRIHRVQIHGEENGAKLAWIHYYIGFVDGTQGELAFTTDEELVATLGDTDRLMAESLTQNATRVANRGTANAN